MKEHGENGSTTTRGMPPAAHLSPSDKLIRDQELQHLVTSSIPSPPYSGLSLINASALVFGADPIYSTHLFASLAANNANARFQLPIPIPFQSLQPALANHPAHQNPLNQHHQRNLFHHLPAAAVPAFAALPGATLPNATQLDILSTWVGEQQQVPAKVHSTDDRKITSTTSNLTVVPSENINNNKNNNKSNNLNNKNHKMRNNNNVANKNNKNLNSGNMTKVSKRNGSGNGAATQSLTNRPGRKPKVGRPCLTSVHESIVSSSENEVGGKKGKFGKETEPINFVDSLIQPFILEKSPVGKMSSDNNSQIQKMEIDCSPPVKSAKSHRRVDMNSSSSSPEISTNNNRKTQGQTSPGQNGARDKVFTCPTCNRCFGYKHVLQNHERTHTGEKPFECNICMKKFTRDHHLKTHMRLHTGEKPYQCTHCDRQFVQVANLRRHLRVHTGERPYACELCSSRFSDSNQLKAHMLIHKGEKPYSCSECGGQFRRRHHLAHHKCVGEDEEPKGQLFQHHGPDDGRSSSSPDTSPPQLLTPASGAGSERNGVEGGDPSILGSGGSSSAEKNGKRERKCRETRRIIRLEGLPVAATITHNNTSPLSSFLPDAAPEQDHPEDLSMSGSTLRGRHYSGSSSSVTASSTPSPRSGLGNHHHHHHHGSLLMRPYCNSITSSEETPDLYSDEDLRAADSSTNGKHESSCDDISIAFHHE